MGSCCCSRPVLLVSEEETTCRRRLRVLLTQRRLRGYSPVEVIQEQHYETEACVSEVVSGHSSPGSELELENDKTEVVVQLKKQITDLQSSLAASKESQLQAERSLAQLQRQHEQLLSRNMQTTPKMTLKALLSDLLEVTDWFHLGINLDIPQYELFNIKSIAQEDALRKTHMLIRWMQLKENPSWTDIVAALGKIRMRGLAHKLAEKYGVTMASEDETVLEPLHAAANSKESQSTKVQVLAGIQTICETLEKQDGMLNAIHANLATARKERQAAYENTLSATQAVEGGLTMLKNLADEQEQLRIEEREQHFLQLCHQEEEKKELKAIVDNKQKKIEQLQSNLMETEVKLKEAQTQGHNRLRQARRELEASCRGVQKLERERTELQDKVNKKRREVDQTLIQTAATFPTQEPVQEVEYQHRQAEELFSESSKLEVTYRQKDSQREEEISVLLAKVRELDSLRLKWNKCPEAPEPMKGGSAAVDEERQTAYFSNYVSVYAYQWQDKEWSKLPNCPQPYHTLALVGGLLTAVGGGEYRKYTNTLLSLVGKGDNRVWEEMFPPMPTKRKLAATVCSGEHLVVIGGREDGRVIRTVEVMNSRTELWFTASSLPFPLSHATATVVGDNIYLAGGHDRHNTMTRTVLTCSLTALLQSCQPHAKCPWHPNPDMVTPSYLSVCVTLSGELVAVGGCDKEGSPTNEVYAYDPATVSWNVISHMDVTEQKCIAVVLPEDRLMVVSGCTSVIGILS